MNTGIIPDYRCRKTNHDYCDEERHQEQEKCFKKDIPKDIRPPCSNDLQNPGLPDLIDPL